MTQTLQDKVVPVLELASAVEIQTAAGWQTAGELAVTIRKLVKEIADTFDEPVKATHQAHKKVIAARNKHSQPLQDAEAEVKKLLLDFYVKAQSKDHAVAVTFPKVPGIQMRKTLKHRIDSDKVPAEYRMVVPDVKAIGLAVKELGMETHIAGVEVYEDWSVVVKAN